MRWYVMHSKPRKESFLFEQLRYQNIEVYNPLLVLKGSHAEKAALMPFFPGYIFIHVDIEAIGFSHLKWIPGAVGIVCFGGEPAYLPDPIMVLVQKKVDFLNASDDKNLPRYKKGDVVLICDGPLAGYRGIFDEYLPGKERARILLKTLSDRALHAEVPTRLLAE